MDPFRDLVVSGGWGLVVWFAIAAAVGSSLHWLEVRARRQSPARPPQGSDSKLPKAA